jgi:hypothetical protein
VTSWVPIHETSLPFSLIFFLFHIIAFSFQNYKENSVQVRAHVITLLAEALCYKPESRRLESRWGHCTFSHLPNPCSRIMTLVYTRPLTHTSIRNLPAGRAKRGPSLRFTSSPPSVSQLSRQYGVLDVSQPYRPERLVTGLALLYSNFLT